MYCIYVKALYAFLWWCLVMFEWSTALCFVHSPLCIINK